MGLGLQGAGGVQAMQEAVRQRIADQLAAQLRAQQAQQKQIENAQRDRQLTMQESSASALEQDRKDRLAETTRNNRVSGSLRMLPLLKPGQMVSAEDAASATEAGLGPFFTQQPMQLPSVSMNGISGSDPTQGGIVKTEAVAGKPAGFEFTGTQADDVRLDDRAFRAGEAEKSRTATDARAQADRELKELIARMSASGSAETRALSNELKSLQIRGEQGKLDATSAAEQAGRTTTTEALSTVEELLRHPGFGAATGLLDPRNIAGGLTQEAVDFNAARDKLIAALTLPNLGQLKGPMSDKDIVFVKQLATRLSNNKMSSAATRLELERARQFLQDKLNADVASAPSAPAGTGVTAYERYLQRQGAR